MPRGEHHGEAPPCETAAMSASVEAQCIHIGGQTVGCGFEAGIEAGDAIGLAHVEEIDGVDGGVAGQES